MLAGTGLAPVPRLILQSCYMCGAWGVSLVNCFCTEEAEVGNFVQQLFKDTPLPSVASRWDGAHAPEQQNVGVGRVGLLSVL